MQQVPSGNEVINDRVGIFNSARTWAKLGQRIDPE
jgi:hypothetical protein